MLVQPGFEPTTSRAADQCFSNWARWRWQFYNSKSNLIFFQLNKEEALEVLPHKKKQASLEEEYEVDI